MFLEDMKSLFMGVKMLDLTRQYDSLREEVAPAIRSIVESQQFINGLSVKKFEESFAKFCNTKFAVGCSSGTDAILMSLMALGIGKGDEVITTPFTFIATVGSIVRLGAIPVFVDIEEKTLNIDPEKIEKAITKKTKAIMPVHIFGQCANMTEINKIAQRNNLFVVEDACQSVGSSWNSAPAGSMGATGCFSFFPSKNLGAFGDGGAVTTNDEDLYQRLLRIRNHGQGNNKTYVYDAIGGNFRLDTIQAAVLNIKLKYLENWSEMRNRNADLYNTSLATIEGIEIPYCHPMSSHVYNQYVIKSKHRDDLREKLSSRDIGSAIYYPSPLHLQSSVSGLGYEEGDFPVAEEACKSVLALPIYPELSKEEIACVISCLGSK